MRQGELATAEEEEDVEGEGEGGVEEEEEEEEGVGCCFLVQDSALMVAQLRENTACCLQINPKDSSGDEKNGFNVCENKRV